MDFYKEIAGLEISKHAESLSHLSNLIWGYAETGYETQKSCEAICKILEKNQFKVIRNFKGIKSTFSAEYGKSKSGSGKTVNVAILCRYDAVPNQGHVRGTNLLAEVAVGAALGLKAVISSTADTLGKVTVIGCPNQEGGGIIPLMRLRAFKGIDVVLSAAPGSNTEWHPLYFGSVAYKALYHGGKADADKVNPPANAMDGAILAYSKVLAMQEHFGRGWKTSGAIAQPGSIWVDRRLCQTVVKLTAPTNPELSFMQTRILSCLNAAAKASGCEVDINQSEYTIHSLISNVELGYLLQLNAYHCGVLSTPKRPREMSRPVDVAEVSRAVPLVRPFFYIGTDAKPGTYEFKQAAKSSAAHGHAIAMAKSLAMTAIDVLHTPGALAQVNAELKRVLADEGNVKFATLPANMPTANTNLIGTDVPSDNGYVGWNRQVY